MIDRYILPNGDQQQPPHAAVAVDRLDETHKLTDRRTQPKAYCAGPLNTYHPSTRHQRTSVAKPIRPLSLLSIVSILLRFALLILLDIKKLTVDETFH